MHKAFPLPVMEFPLPEEIPTASEESSHCQKKRDPTAVKIALLLKSSSNRQSKSYDSYANKYKTAQELWAAILKTFSGNEATKKTKKNLLKQQYGNFKAEGSETLEQTFNRLQVIVSQLQFMDVEIEQDDLNQKFLTSLASEWLMHTIVWRNRSDLDTMSVDDCTIISSISQDTACAYIASQSNDSQIKFEDINQIDQDDIEEMDIKWNMALLSLGADRFCKKIWKKISIQGTDMAGFDKLKVKCFNCHKMGHFARKCRAPRSQDRGKRDNYRQGSKVEEHAPKALMAIDEVGWDWSYKANDDENHALVADEEAPSEFTLMAKTSAESEVFDNSLCSKTCKKNSDSLNSKITELNDKLCDAKNKIYHYKLKLAQVEARLAEHRNQELKYYEKIRILEVKTKSRANCIKGLTKELELIKKEKEGLETKLTGFQTALKDIDSLLESQRLDKNKEGLGYSDVPSPPAHVYSPPKKDMYWTGLPEFKDDTVTDYSRPAPTVESSPDDAQNRNPSVTATKASPSTITPKPFIKFVKATDSSQNNINDKGYWDSGCSRHMTGNISYLSDYEPFEGGYVSFGQGGCKITSKGTIKTSKLEFENVYFVKDLKYNLFRVSQICDNKNSVLFTDSECIVLGRDFKLLDDANVLLRTPRQHNMYSIDLNNIVPHKDLTCLVANAFADECMLWHRRLVHLNFKTMNRLVRHNLVRGLPSKCFENDHTCTACLKRKQHKASLLAISGIA
nr:ribonuclease H-like domain-containing protein [Tanacetum cinerariifolium]